MTLLTSIALGCGGLFCDAASVPTSVAIPVQQTEEAVVFHVDPVADTTTMHVQISYEGPVDEFAWILPVPGLPELDRSTHRLFEQLRANTQERWTRTDFVSSNCSEPREEAGESDADTDADTDTDTDADADADGPTPVTVVSREEVGPYETVVLTATGSQELLTWLQDNHYQVPDGLEPLLAPYIAPDMHFVALKLRKDQAIGDMEPLALTLDGTDPSIPMQLTAVAAADDMPLSVYMLGESRAMPLNYLHVERNLARARWPNANGPAFIGQQPELTAEAVDAAGGLAFATLYAGPPWGVRGDVDEDFRTLTDLRMWVLEVNSLGLDLTDAEAAYVLDLPESTKVTANDVLSCSSCYPHLKNAVDLEAASARLMERVIEPLNAANAMVRQSPYLTRLQTALSPGEMTVDPRFVFTEGLPDIFGRHTLDTSRSCELENGRTVGLVDAPYSFTIDGHFINGPSHAYLLSHRIGMLEWLREEYANPAWSIDAIDEQGSVHRVFEDYPAGDSFVDRVACGCNQSSRVLGLSFLPLLTLLVRRRLG